MKVFAIILTISLLGCDSTLTPATSDWPPQHNIDRKLKVPSADAIELLYLKGSFNLWSYQEQYRLQQVRPNVYSAAVRLKANQPQELMFSAKDPSLPNANCGYLKASDRTLTLGAINKATCQKVVLENFIFVPTQDAVYEFLLDFSKTGRPLVYVEKAF